MELPTIQIYKKFLMENDRLRNWISWERLLTSMLFLYNNQYELSNQKRFEKVVQKILESW